MTSISSTTLGSENTLPVEAARGSSQKILRIDALRGVAILAVMAFHFLVEIYGYRDVWSAPAKSWWAFLPIAYGWTGVCLFFVISGYVIHRSFLTSRSFSWRGYVSRRFWRLYPAYIVVAVALVLLHGVSITSPDAILHFVFLHNATEATFYGLNGSFWSIAVEVQFYAMFPAALLVRRHFGLSAMFWFSVAVGLLWLVGAYAFLQLPPSPWATVFDHDAKTNWNLWASPFVLWPSWMIGAVLTERHLQGARVFRAPVLSATAFAALAFACSLSAPLYPFQFVLAGLFWAVLTEAYILREGPLSQIEKVSAFIGLCSYSIYLVHQPLIPFFRRFWESFGLYNWPLLLVAGLALFIPAMIALGWVMYRLIEVPGVRFGARRMALRAW